MTAHAHSAISRNLFFHWKFIVVNIDPSWETGGKLIIKIDQRQENIGIDIVIMISPNNLRYFSVYLGELILIDTTVSTDVIYMAVHINGTETESHTWYQNMPTLHNNDPVMVGRFKNSSPDSEMTLAQQHMQLLHAYWFSIYHMIPYSPTENNAKRINCVISPRIHNFVETSWVRTMPNTCYVKRCDECLTFMRDMPIFGASWCIPNAYFCRVVCHSMRNNISALR